MLFAVAVSFAATAIGEVGYKFYGQVRADLFYNSRSNSETVDGLFYMYPKDKELDADGKDLNAKPDGNLYTMYTRLGVDLTASKLGSKVEIAGKMLTSELEDLVHEIVSQRCERQNIELKRASRGTPEKLYDTLSSFSNQTGGGIIVFGIDEKNGYEISGVYDAQDLQAKVTAQALQNSCNIAFAHIALKLGGERFYEYIEKFGILEKTGIDLAGESKGVFFDKALITNTDKWGTASLTSGSFGQTFKITPLQLVRAIASVVNGGNLLEPYIVSEIVDADGNTLMKAEPTVSRQTISPETSRTMCTLIESVVTDGTAKNAQVAGFSIGGKTGTSEKIDVFDENGQRVQDKIVSFVGIAPMNDPEYIVLVALDTPSRETGIYISGGVMAAPTVGAVMADILPYLGVERSYADTDPAGVELVMEDLTGLTVDEAGSKLKELGLTGSFSGTGETVVGQIPAPGQTIPGGSQVLVYLQEQPEEVQVAVPDFTGMNRQQASDAAGKLGLYILVAGNSEISPQVTVTAQNIPKDTQVAMGTTITLEFTNTTARD